MVIQVAIEHWLASEKGQCGWCEPAFTVASHGRAREPQTVPVTVGYTGLRW